MKDANEKRAKVCTIINGEFTWMLRVDGRTISFNDFDGGDYFEQLYRGLGYEVRREDHSQTPDQ